MASCRNAETTVLLQQGALLLLQMLFRVQRVTSVRRDIPEEQGGKQNTRKQFSYELEMAKRGYLLAAGRCSDDTTQREIHCNAAEHQTTGLPYLQVSGEESTGKVIHVS